MTGPPDPRVRRESCQAAQIRPGHRPGPAWAQHPAGGSDAERGAVAVWAIGLAFLAFAGCGLIVDVGGALNAKVATLDVAQQAARAGAQHLDLAALRRDGVIRLDPAAARAAAQAFLRTAGLTGTVTATPGRVQVTATSSHPAVLLSVAGVKAIAVTATAYAAPATG